MLASKNAMAIIMIPALNEATLFQLCSHIIMKGISMHR